MSDLRHHGIKGQKWGVRRFQNADGSLTAAGRKRYGDGESSYDYGKDSGGRKVVRVGKGSNDNNYKSTLDKVNSAGKIVDEMKKYSNSSQKSNDANMERRIRKSINEMSDKELQQRVQRLNMEDNYTRMMMHRENLERGESFVNKALNVSSTALQGAAAALTIAMMVKQLKG